MQKPHALDTYAVIVAGEPVAFARTKRAAEKIARSAGAHPFDAVAPTDHAREVWAMRGIGVPDAVIERLYERAEERGVSLAEFLRIEISALGGES